MESRRGDIIGAEVNGKEGRGWTPLQCAIQSGIKNVIPLLIENGAEVDDNCLMFAISTYQFEVLQI